MKIKSFGKRHVSFILILLLAATACGVIWGMQWLTRPTRGTDSLSIDSSPVPDLAMRQIETKNRLWINGHLGLFFRYEIVGYWNWLTIPLLLVFFWNWKERDRWERALICVFALSFGLIALKGYFNYRYAATLLPVTLAFILACSWNFRDRSNRLLQYGFFGIIFLLILFGIQKKNLALPQTLFPPKDDPLPRGIFQQIIKMKMQPDDAFLECNAPAFYYYTNKRGLSYNIRFLHETPGIITKNGIIDIFRDNSKTEKLNADELGSIFTTLKNQHHVKYIFTLSLPDYYQSLNSIILYGCDLFADEKGYRLYKLRDQYQDPFFAITKRRPDFQFDFSSWRGPEIVRSADLDKTVPPLMVLGIRGEFGFSISSGPANKVLQVSPIQKGENGEILIFIGFWLNKNGFDLKMEPGKLAIFRAIVNLSTPSREAAKILVEEKIEDWKIESFAMDQPGWHQYDTTKRIRENTSDLIYGIVWKPEKMTDRLEIKEFQIFIL